MEVICIDTGVLIEYYRNKNKEETYLFNLSKKYKFAIPTIVEYEILRGDKKKDEFWIRLFGQMQTLPFDKLCAHEAANIYKILKDKNKLIEMHDILIAAICLRNKYRLASLNKRHFERIDGLTLVNI